MNLEVFSKLGASLPRRRSRRRGSGAARGKVRLPVPRSHLDPPDAGLQTELLHCLLGDDEAAVGGAVVRHDRAQMKAAEAERALIRRHARGLSCGRAPLPVRNFTIKPQASVTAATPLR